MQNDIYISHNVFSQINSISLFLFFQKKKLKNNLKKRRKKFIPTSNFTF